jgi:hypothetical protein
LAGSSYAISVTNPHSFRGDSISVWADWNKDGDFTDSGEEYSLSYSSNFDSGNGPGYGTGSIAVPAGASNGNVRMRIRVVYQETPLACGNTEFGEIEDYTLVVSGGVTNSTCPTYDKLVLTINAVTSSSNSIAICSSALPYSWNGLTFNAAGTQTKTGLTNPAGWCLGLVVEQNQQRYIVVILGARNKLERLKIAKEIMYNHLSDTDLK